MPFYCNQYIYEIANHETMIEGIFCYQSIRPIVLKPSSSSMLACRLPMLALGRDERASSFRRFPIRLLPHQQNSLMDWFHALFHAANAIVREKHVRSYPIMFQTILARSSVFVGNNGVKFSFRPLSLAVKYSKNGAAKDVYKWVIGVSTVLSF